VYGMTSNVILMWVYEMKVMTNIMIMTVENEQCSILILMTMKIMIYINV